MEGSLVAYKVFTNGSVLNASEINDNLMNQAVITFTNSTARASAITSPVEGMVTYLADTDTYQFWNGTAWANLVPPATSGLNLITTQTFTGVASVSLGSNASPIFSSTYDNYRIVFDTGSSTDTARTISLRMRANTTDDSTLFYSHANSGIDATGTAQNSSGTGQSSSLIVSSAHFGNSRVVATFDLVNPFIADQTFGLGINRGILNSGNMIHQSLSFQNANFTSFNGFTLLNSAGNFTNGRISVYGYGK